MIQKGKAAVNAAGNLDQERYKNNIPGNLQIGEKGEVRDSVAGGTNRRQSGA